MNKKQQDDTGPGWQERLVHEHGKTSGQAGGQPTEQRGPAQSGGGEPQEDANSGDTKDISPRGGVGIREDEKQPGRKK